MGSFCWVILDICLAWPGFQLPLGSFVILITNISSSSFSLCSALIVWTCTSQQHTVLISAYGETWNIFSYIKFLQMFLGRWYRNSEVMNKINEKSPHIGLFFVAVPYSYCLQIRPFHWLIPTIRCRLIGWIPISWSRLGREWNRSVAARAGGSIGNFNASFSQSVCQSREREAGR